MSLHGLVCFFARTRAINLTGSPIFAANSASRIHSAASSSSSTRAYSAAFSSSSTRAGRKNLQSRRRVSNVDFLASSAEAGRRWASALAPGNGLIFRQMFDKESWTYSYLLADEETKEAVIIDPVIDQVERDIKVVEQNGLKLVYAINTHVHADHITGSGVLKRRIPGVKSCISQVSGGKADVYLSHGDALAFGRHSLEARSTPGHTSGCMSFVLASAGVAFTGDALLIRGCGRTDFQEGDAAMLYDSVWREILSLPDTTLLYPAHDYVGLSATTVGEEKVHNPRLSKSKEVFVDIMNNLNLAYPKQIDRSLPANLVCGLQESLHVHAA